MANTRRVPVQNYVKLGLLILGVVILVVFLGNWYRNYREYQLTIPVIEGTFQNEIKGEEVYNYMLENENAILYLGTASDEDCRKLEKELKKYVVEENLQQVITYLNLSEVENTDDFFQTFYRTYPFERYLDVYPAIVLFEDGKVKAIAAGSETSPLTIEDVKSFFQTYGIKDRNV